MGSVVQVVVPDVVLVAACALVVLVGLAAVVVLRGRARRRRQALDQELVRSRDEVDALSQKLEQLAGEVARSQRTAELDREYVITSLGAGADPGLPVRPAGAVPDVPSTPDRRLVGRAIEHQLVVALARRSRASLVEARGTELVVKAMALGHGVRRALSPDVLDRAAAEAQVARRRSRRDRRREIREARRSLQTSDRGREVA